MNTAPEQTNSFGDETLCTVNSGHSCTTPSTSLHQARFENPWLGLEEFHSELAWLEVGSTDIKKSEASVSALIRPNTLSWAGAGSFSRLVLYGLRK